MAMVCPQCSESFEQSLHCPKCGARLLYQSKTHNCDGDFGGVSGHVMQSTLGRIACGVLLAQGIAYGLQMLCHAGMQVVVADAHQTVWSTLFGLVLLQAIQGLSLLAGGALAGATQRRPAVLGAVVGAVHGSLFLVFLHLQGERPTDVALYGQPMLHIAFGALGAVIGASGWKPLPILAMPDFETDVQSKAARRPTLTFAALRGPVAWGRVSTGIVIVTAGLLWGPGLLTVLLAASQGTLKINDHLQAQLVTWEIIGLITLTGAAFAGATTRNGLKQGLFVGVGASILMIGNYLGGKTVALELIFYTTFSILGLTIAGGWFGGQLFPQVAAVPRRLNGRYPV